MLSSSRRTRRPWILRARAAAVAASSPRPTPTSTTSPAPIAPTRSPSTVTEARVTRCTTARISPTARRRRQQEPASDQVAHDGQQSTRDLVGARVVAPPAIISTGSASGTAPSHAATRPATASSLSSSQRMPTAAGAVRRAAVTSVLSRTRSSVVRTSPSARRSRGHEQRRVVVAGQPSAPLEPVAEVRAGGLLDGLRNVLAHHRAGAGVVAPQRHEPHADRGDLLGVEPVPPARVALAPAEAARHLAGVAQPQRDVLVGPDDLALPHPGVARRAGEPARDPGGPVAVGRDDPVGEQRRAAGRGQPVRHCRGSSVALAASPASPLSR